MRDDEFEFAKDDEREYEDNALRGFGDSGEDTVPESGIGRRLSELGETATGGPSGGGDRVTVGGELYDWAQALVTAVIFIVLMFTFVGRIIGVQGTSMIPTLYEGDRVVLQTLLYEPKAGDIVVLTKKSYEEDKPLVKRIIATENQEVYIDFDAGNVWVDGVLEAYVDTPITKQGDVQFPVKVPEGCVFVLGDNRNGSTDSRYSVIGMIDERMILGRVVLRVYPFGSFGVVD